MKIEIIKDLSNSDLSQIYNIWNSVYPTQAVFMTENDFRVYLDKTSDKTHFIFRNNALTIDGWLMTFTRDDNRYFVLLVSENNQGKGIGTTLIKEMKKIEGRVAGWIVELDTYLKLDGSLYHSPISFYKKLGFSITKEKSDSNGFSTIKIIWQRIV